MARRDKLLNSNQRDIINKDSLENKVVCPLEGEYIIFGRHPHTTQKMQKPCERIYPLGELCYCDIKKYKKCEYAKEYYKLWKANIVFA